MAVARIRLGAPATFDLLGLTGRGAAPSAPPAERSLVARHPTRKPYGWAVLAMGAIVGLAFLIQDRIKDAGFDAAPSPAPAPVEGLTIFAVFFVAALALERLLEPLSKVLLPSDEKKEAEEEKAADAQEIALELAEHPADAEKRESAQSAVKGLAEVKADREAREKERAIVFWGLATILAMVASAALKLYFLRTVGIADASRVWQILATGLIIGGGTKPLHDFIAMIQAKKEASQKQADQ